ncbi:hypothetical protein O181_030785 [Austropuccinia psidii MF-1]|uniref:Uncharacterized protein n=1 Tax=Austropuccinia psidii MF-1 TaxID=1389203 RepID=A0A9Q3CWS8_9BASI|nr:hypothetical protein [Austropuccinia psidii MF-1]
MVGTETNIEHHEDNNTKTNHKRKLTQSQRQLIHDSKQIISHLGHSNRAKREYKNFSTISIDKKEAKASYLKLPSVNRLPHPYVIIDKKNPFLPVIIYEITPFENSSGQFQILKGLITLSQTFQEIKTIKQVLGGIIKGICFCPGSDSGKSAAVYSQKPGLTPHQIETNNEKCSKLQQYDKFIFSGIYHFFKLSENENKSLMEAAKLSKFTQLEWTSANPKEELKYFTKLIFNED